MWGRSCWKSAHEISRHSRESGNPAAFLRRLSMRGGFVYMMADRYRGTIYTGVTASIARRTFQHRAGVGSRFVRRYELLRLVYIERHEDIRDAIAREKAIKKWRRDWKIGLIETANPEWIDLFETINA